MTEMIIYDFCQTIVDYESADDFCLFVYKELNDKKRKIYESVAKLLLVRVLTYLLRLLQHDYILTKHILLKSLKGIHQDEIERLAQKYYRDVVRNHIRREIVDLISDQQKSGKMIVVVSVAYEPYLRCFADEYDIDYLITNEFLYDGNGVFTGKIKTSDCIGMNKLLRFRNFCEIE